MFLWPSQDGAAFKSKLSVVQNEFLPAAVSVKFSLLLVIVTLPPAVQSIAHGTLKYLRLFWFSLLQECTACVIVSQRSGAYPQYLKITTRLHSLKAREAEACFSFTCVSQVSVIAVYLTSLCTLLLYYVLSKFKLCPDDGQMKSSSS